MKPRVNATDLLQVGFWFQREERLFQITVWDPKDILSVTARAADTGEILQFSLTTLFASTPSTRFAPTQDELIVPLAANQTGSPNVYDADTLPNSLLSRADRIIQVVEAVGAHLERIVQRYQRINKPFLLKEVTRQACKLLPEPVSISTYYAYRKLYRTHVGDRALIAGALRRESYGKTRIHPNAQHFIDTIVRRFYRSNPPLRAQTVYDIATRLWEHNRHWWLDFQQTGPNDELIERLLNARQPIDDLLADKEQRRYLTQIKLPSRSWFYGYVRWFEAQPNEGAKSYIIRHGQAEWEANFLLFDRFCQTATLPLQYVFADHYKLDVLHVDDEFREVLGRLWLTLLVDAYSRMVLGLHISYEDPTIESIQQALHHAIWPKQNLSEFKIDLSWICYGVPQRLLLDNAWAHQSHSLETLVQALAGGGRYTQMELVFRPPYQARYGGLVERLFGNLAGQLRERLPGAILHPTQRQWHNASQAACLLYSDVVQVVYQLLVDYLHTPHRELSGLTPHEKWLIGLQLMAFNAPLTPHLERCFWRLYPDTRRATHMGLALFGLHYWAQELTGLRAPDRQGRPRQFHLRYNPADVSRVAIFENGVWLGDGYARQLRLSDGSYESVSLWELKLAKELVRQRNQGRATRPHSWLIHLLETRELIAQRQAEQKLIRRKVQQLREQKRGRPPSATKKQQVLESEQLNETAQAMVEVTTEDHDPRAHLLENWQEVL